MHGLRKLWGLAELHSLLLCYHNRMDPLQRGHSAWARCPAGTSYDLSVSCAGTLGLQRTEPSNVYL